ncbi:Fc.00g032350.m01.CDS01 [Cosmosporella sp. VM-42]
MTDLAVKGTTPSKPCHTCRRRRVTCDRTYPNCEKCKRSGQECLGYDKLFRWTEGVASRGKLASGKMIMFRTKANEGQSPPSPRILVDPLFQDVEEPYRRYLSYFSNRLCLDLVSYDLPGRNPFRDLIPLTKPHPLIFHTLVAVSAAHMSNLTRIQSPHNPDASRALVDALIAKQAALRLLSKAINDVGSVDADVILAAILFFVNIELIESGKEAWMAHLEGAMRFMAALKPAADSTTALRDYVMSDCLIYYVLSSAFKPSVPSNKSYFHSAEVSAILARTSVNQYLCCPPEILQILLEATEISNHADGTDSAAQIAEAGAKLVERALAVDVHVWACAIRNIPCFSSIPVESRIHVGSAHRLTACLFILQAIPMASLLVSTTVDELCEEIHHHLTFIPPEDPNFKATPWQTFVLCASVTDPVIRKWALDRFKWIVERCPWGFLRTAYDTLQTLWKSDESDVHTADRMWVHKLRDSGQNFVIV